MDAIFSTPDPARAVELLIGTKIVDVILCPLVDTNLANEGFQILFRAQALLNQLCQAATRSTNGQVHAWDVNRRQFLWYAAFFEPIYKLSSDCASDEKRSKRCRRKGSKTFTLLNELLKRPAGDIQAIESILKGADTLCAFLKEQDTGHDSSLMQFLASNHDFTDLSASDPKWKHIQDLRWKYYKLLKHVGPLWKESLILALSQESSPVTSENAVERYSQLGTIMEDRLSLDVNLKPLLNPSHSHQGWLVGWNFHDDWNVRTTPAVLV